MNCKEEFLRAISGKKVMCAFISKNGGRKKTLKVGFSDKDFKVFLKTLDFEYDSGYGLQEVFGCIWYLDGTWSSRGEYDGSEWWVFNKCPEILEVLK